MGSTLRLLSLPLLILALAPWAAAQNADRPRLQVWDEAFLVNLPDGNNPFVLETRQGAANKVIPPPSIDESQRLGRSDWAHGKAWYVRLNRKDGPEGKRYQSEILRWDGRSWAREGTTEWMPYRLRAIAPLDNGDYLIVSGEQAFEDGDHFAPVAVMRPDSKGILRIHRLQDLGLERPTFPKNIASPTGAYPGLDPLDFIFPVLVRVPGYLILLASDSGHAFIFRSTDGRLARTAQLYPGVGEKALQHGRLLQGLVGCQPRSDGDVLVAAFPEDFVLTAALRKDVNVDPRDIGADDTLHPTIAKSFREGIDARLKQAGPLEWYALDPETGQYRLVAPPQNVKQTFKSPEDLFAFRWRFKPDGNLLVEANQEGGRIPEPEEKPRVRTRK